VDHFSKKLMIKKKVKNWHKSWKQSNIISNADKKKFAL